MSEFGANSFVGRFNLLLKNFESAFSMSAPDDILTMYKFCKHVDCSSDYIEIQVHEAIPGQYKSESVRLSSGLEKNLNSCREVCSVF